MLSQLYMSVHIAPMNLVACQVCVKLFPSKKQAVEHQAAVHIARMVECNVCFAVVKGMRGLRKHKQSACTMSTRHACGQCGRTYATARYAARHEASCSVTRVRACSGCGRVYGPGPQFARHRAVCGARSPCGRKFASGPGAAAHVCAECPDGWYTAD